MDDTPFSVSETPQTFSAPKKRNQKRFALLIVVVLIIIIFSVFITIANTRKSTEETTTTTTSTTIDLFMDEEVVSDEEVTPEPEETNTPTPKPTANPVDSKTGLNRSKLTIEIQNGSGVAGAAGKASTYLEELGYSISTTGNADNFDYENVTIQVKNSSSDYLSLLELDLGKNYTVGDTSSNLSASVSADALVIIGK